MKIGLTGNKGFIGAKVQSRLEAKGHEVIGFDKADGFDLKDASAVSDFVAKCDIVYHIAAQADLTTMYTTEGARDGFEDNVIGTNNLAYECARRGVWLIFASTVCVYGNVQEHPEREDVTLPNPSEMYACTKYAAEWVVKGYGHNFKMPWTILRFATIYGGGMRPAMGLHIFIRQALAGEPITVHGDGLQDRTLTHVNDLVDGIVSVIEREENARGQIFNLSSPIAISALKMAQDVKVHTGSTSEIEFIEQRDNQTFHEDFDVSKAKELLGWEAQVDWDLGLEESIEYIKKHG